MTKKMMLYLKLAAILTFLLLLGCGSKTDGGGGSQPGSVKFKVTSPLDVIGDITIETADKLASVTFAKDLFPAGTEVEFSNILAGLPDSGFPEGRQPLAAVEFKKINEPEALDGEAGTGDGDGGTGEGGEGEPGEDGEDGGDGEGGGESGESEPEFADDIGGAVTLSTTLSEESSWPAGSSVTLYKYSEDLGLWQDSGKLAALNGEGRVAISSIDRFGKYAVFSALPIELPPPMAGGLKLEVATLRVVKLGWDVSDYPFLDGYNLYRAAEQSGEYTKANSELVTGTEFSEEALGIGTFYYRLTLVSTAGLEGEPGDALPVKVSGTDFAGFFGPLQEDNGALNMPLGVVVVSERNEVLITDTGNARIIVYDLLGHYIRAVDTLNHPNIEFVSPVGMALSPDGERLYLADAGLNRVLIFSPALILLESFGGAGSDDGQLSSPRDVAVRSDGVVFVSDTGNHRIQYFTPSGTYLGRFGKKGAGDGELSSPGFITLNPDGDLFVSDVGNLRVVQFSSSFEFLRNITFEGQVSEFVPPLGAPGGLALDTEGHLYISDSSERRILAADNAGDFFFMFAAPGGEEGEFGLESPQGLAYDPVTGLLYACDTANNRIQVFQP